MHLVRAIGKLQRPSTHLLESPSGMAEEACIPLTPNREATSDLTDVPTLSLVESPLCPDSSPETPASHEQTYKLPSLGHTTARQFGKDASDQHKISLSLTPSPLSRGSAAGRGLLDSTTLDAAIPYFDFSTDRPVTTGLDKSISTSRSGDDNFTGARIFNLADQNDIRTTGDTPIVRQSFPQDFNFTTPVKPLLNYVTSSKIPTVTSSNTIQAHLHMLVTHESKVTTDVLTKESSLPACISKSTTETTFTTTHTDSASGMVRCDVYVNNASRRLAKILPYDSIQRLLKQPNHCIANNTKTLDERCQHKTSWRTSSTIELLSMISKLDENCTLKSAKPVIMFLLQRAISGSALHKKRAEENLTHLQRILDDADTGGKLASKVGAGSDTHNYTLSDLMAVQAWLAALTLTNFTGNKTGPLEVKQEFEPPSLVFTHRSLADLCDLGALEVNIEISYTLEPETKSQRKSQVRVCRGIKNVSSNRVYHTTSQISTRSSTAIGQVFVQHEFPLKTRDLTDTEALRWQFSKQMGVHDMNEWGYIYIYWIPGNFGYVKIGVTNRPLEKRLGEWERKCGHTTMSHYCIDADGSDNPSGTTAMIPHVYRVEKLIHMELRRYRVVETSCRCGKQHIEWFRVSVEAAIIVALKWSQWMVRNHIAFRNLLENPSSSLNPKFTTYSRDKVGIGIGYVSDEKHKENGTSITQDEIDRMCTPLSLDSSVSSQGHGSKTGARHSKSVQARPKSIRRPPLRRSPRNHSQSKALDSGDKMSQGETVVVGSDKRDTNDNLETTTDTKNPHHMGLVLNTSTVATNVTTSVQGFTTTTKGEQALVEQSTISTVTEHTKIETIAIKQEAVERSVVEQVISQEETLTTNLIAAIPAGTRNSAESIFTTICSQEQAPSQCENLVMNAESPWQARISTKLDTSEVKLSLVDTSVPYVFQA